VYVCCVFFYRKPKSTSVSTSQINDASSVNMVKGDGWVVSPCPLPPPITVKSSFCSGVLSVNCVDRELKRLFGNRKANRFLELSAALKSPFFTTKVYESHQNVFLSLQIDQTGKQIFDSQCIMDLKKRTLHLCVIVVFMKHQAQ